MFKVGDKVKCIDDLGAGLELTQGQMYTIRSYRGDAFDEVYLEGVGFSWLVNRFEKVDNMTIEINSKAKSKKADKTQANIFYVRRVGTVTEKVVHKTFEDARNEANRLAELTPNHEFQVLAVAYTVKKVPVYTTESQEYGV